MASALDRIYDMIYNINTSCVNKLKIPWKEEEVGEEEVEGDEEEEKDEDEEDEEEFSRKNGMVLPSYRRQLMTSAKTIDATFEN